MKRLTATVSLILLLASVLLAAEDLTGKWAGSFNVTFSDGATKDAKFSPMGR